MFLACLLFSMRYFQLFLNFPRCTRDGRGMLMTRLGGGFGRVLSRGQPDQYKDEVRGEIALMVGRSERPSV